MAEKSLFVKGNDNSILRRARKPKQVPVKNQATYYGPANNALQHVPNKIKRYKEDKIANTLTYKRDKDFIVRIMEYGKPLPESAQRLIAFAQIELSRKNKWRSNDVKSAISLDFNEYAAWRVAKTPKARLRLREEIKEALKCLIKTQVAFKSDKKRCCMVANIIASYTAFEDSPNQLLVNFTQEYAMHSIGNFIGQLDPRLFALDARNPNTFKIGHKLCEHWHSEEMRKNGTHNRLYLTTLLEAAPDLPTLEEEKAGGRHYRQCIFDPLEICLEQLVDEEILTQFEWRKKGGSYLTDRELAILSCDELKEICLYFELPNRPSQGRFSELALEA